MTNNDSNEYIGRTVVLAFNSIFLLVYALFLIAMIVKKTHYFSLNGKLGFQLLISSILYSVALTINGESQSDGLSTAQIIQIVLTVQSLLTTMSFVSAISYILYTNFRSPETISNNSRKYLIVLSLICWLLPVPITSISCNTFGISVPNQTKSFNFIQSLPVYYIFYSLFLISYVITFIYITLLKIEVNKFIKEYGDDPKYKKYITKLNLLVAIVIISAIIFVIDILNEAFEGKMDRFCDILEPLIIPFFFCLFAMNGDHWKEFKNFYSCKKEPQEQKLFGNDNENELL